jgi:HPt (histidine-containing phosphotransfer) domain-containing protein
MTDQEYQITLPVYLALTRECLHRITDAVSLLSHDASDAEARRQLAFNLHAIRGGASALGLRSLAAEAERLESWATVEARAFGPGRLAALYDAIGGLRKVIDEVERDLGAGAGQ